MFEEEEKQEKSGFVELEKGDWRKTGGGVLSEVDVALSHSQLATYIHTHT